MKWRIIWSWTIAPGPCRTKRKHARVYYISGTGNLFLEQVLRSLPGVQTFRGDPNNRRLPAEDFDLYIFDSWLPNSLPTGDMLLVNPPSSTSLFTVGGSHEASDRIEVAPADSGITAYVDLDEMSLLQYRSVTAEWAQALVTAPEGPLLLAGEVNAQQIAILPFDLRDSNLPLLIAWPVLMANLMDWYSPAEIVDLPDGLTVGDVLVIAPPLRAELVRITAPDGSMSELPVAGESLAFTDTGQLGLYRARDCARRAKSRNPSTSP